MIFAEVVAFALESDVMILADVVAFILQRGDSLEFVTFLRMMLVARVLLLGVFLLRVLVHYSRVSRDDGEESQAD